MDNSMPTWATILIAIGTLVGGGVGSKILDIYMARNKFTVDKSKQENDQDLAKNKQLSELRIAENEQAFKIYKEMLDSLKHDVNKLSDDMSKLEKEHLGCREENASMRAEIKLLNQQMTEVRNKS